MIMKIKKKRIISEQHIYSPEHNNRDYNENNFQRKIIKDISKRNNNDNYRLKENSYNKNIIDNDPKRGRSTRQKNSFSEIIPMDIAL